MNIVSYTCFGKYVQFNSEEAINKETKKHSKFFSTNQGSLYNIEKALDVIVLLMFVPNVPIMIKMRA